MIFDLPKGDLHCQERDAYFTMDLTGQMCQKGWKLMGKMMCSCSDYALKILCTVSFLNLQILVTNFSATKQQLGLLSIT